MTKVLYLTVQQQNLWPGIVGDYLCDLTLHGLRELLGPDCVDYPEKRHLYDSYPHQSNMWGRGFTYSGMLKEGPVDRTDIDNKIKTGFFDVIIVAIHHTMHHSPQETLKCLSAISQLAPSTTRIAVLDGNDLTNCNLEFFNYAHFYFKRELTDDQDSRILPISFSIPKHKIVETVYYLKTRDFSYITPGSIEAHWPQDSRMTHSYETENAYYADYRNSFFGLTCKKGGWDCMRHYEILGNGCVPIFTDIEWCPNRTLTTLPKDVLSTVKHQEGIVLATRSQDKITYGGHDIIQHKSYIDKTKFDLAAYYRTAESLLDWTRTFLTTERNADRLLRTINVN